jgi:hypothetical protein
MQRIGWIYGCIANEPDDFCVITLADFDFNVYGFSENSVDLNIQTKTWM